MADNTTSLLLALYSSSTGFLGGCGGHPPADDDDTLSQECDPSTYRDDNYIECGVGSCFNMVPATVCNNGSIVVNVCEPLESLPEVCDGEDNDCNGEIDDVETRGDTCAAGLGVCESLGEMDCVADELVCTAEPLTSSEPESCGNMGADNDCDGRLDNIRGLGNYCENDLLGECFRTGVKVCLEDSLVCDVDYPEKGLESCANIGTDDDCNGEIDNMPDIGLPCSNEMEGECLKEGVIECDGEVEACSAPVVESGVESCSNMGHDDDCDGTTDNIPDLGVACNNGLPEPCFETGITICAGGELACDTPALRETCSDMGVDNDCNGVTDDVPGVGVLCNNGLLGECFETGVKTCVGGLLQCNAPRPSAGVERCSNMGHDDDCDGSTDEEIEGVGVSCDNGQLGVCFDTGVTECGGGEVVCNAPQHSEGTETCFNMDADDNCDGLPDNVPQLDAICNNGMPGACFTEGAYVCMGGAEPECDAPIFTETCANMGNDDDCNGTPDDVPGRGISCDNGDIGACFAEGVMECIGGAEPECSAPEIEPTDEVCDRVDNDCDGETDNDAYIPDLSAGNISISANDLMTLLSGGSAGSEIDVETQFVTGTSGAANDELVICDMTAEASAISPAVTPCFNEPVYLECGLRLLFDMEIYPGLSQWSLMSGEEIVGTLTYHESGVANFTVEKNDGECYYFHSTSVCE